VPVAGLPEAVAAYKLLNSTETVPVPRFAEIRSGLPSPFKSAVVTDSGEMPLAKVC